MQLVAGQVNRWTPTTGSVTDASGNELSVSELDVLMPTLGTYDVELGGEIYQMERVGARYCTYPDVVAYGRANGDGFDDETRYPADAVWQAIQQAEEAIEEGTGRSFCSRSLSCTVSDGLDELPVEDVRTVSMGTLLNGRQLRSGGGEVDIVYGAKLTASIRDACTRLAASYIRPRVTAENARGTSMDGVYISYELATGDEGSWTGLPAVDAVIERNRSHRVVVL